MQKRHLADELMDVRAQIENLRRREERLQAALSCADGAPAAPPRPGWPIRRIPAADAGASFH